MAVANTLQNTTRYDLQNKEFDVLDSIVVEYSKHTELFCHLLRSSSADALNTYCGMGWTILSYFLWKLNGDEGEVEILETLFGAEVAAEDHSRLRMDKDVLSFTTEHKLVRSFCPVHADSLFAQSNPSKVYQYSPLHILDIHEQCIDPYSFQTKIHISIARNLFLKARERIQTYPKRLMNTLTNVCADCLPTKTLYTIIAAYLCH
jgi:hypothetical protein